MALYPEPWLSKPSVLATCERLIGESAFRARGLLGGLHFGSGDPSWLAPSGNPRAWRTRDLEPGFGAPAGSLADGLDRLAHSRTLRAGSFVFVLSDFLDPVPDEAWLAAAARGWDLVPVIVQDPTWEASFPVETGGLVLPLVDAGTGTPSLVRLTTEDARARRSAHESRLARLVGGLAELGLDPIRLTCSDPDAILAAFVAWATARLAPAGRAW
jgi:hypothetical protein